MEHIDEGTIHAWLDGALPADEGARIEAHVAACAACAAAVAEARGLIAASSRILSALDDVPGGVIPVVVVSAESVTARTTSANNESAERLGEASRVVKTSRAAEGTSPSHGVGAAGRRVRRPWYRRPQWAAAAGISFLAIAATAVWQRSDAPSVMDSASERVAAPAPMAADAAAERTVDSMSRAAEPGVASGGSSTAPAPSVQQAAKARAAMRADAPSSNEQKSAAGAGVPVEARKEVAAMAKRARQEDTVAQDAVADVARDARRAAPVPAAPPPAVAAATAEALAKRELDSVAAKRVGSITADAITRSESARVAGEVSAQRKAANSLAQVTTTAASAAAPRAPAALRARGVAAVPPTPASVAGCYRVQPSDAARAAGLGGIVQLDFAGAGSDEARPAYAARELDAGNVQPATARPMLRWTLSTSGEVVLVRGEGAEARRVTLRIDVPVDSLAPQQLQGTRAVCPSR